MWGLLQSFRMPQVLLLSMLVVLGAPPAVLCSPPVPVLPMTPRRTRGVPSSSTRHHILQQQDQFPLHQLNFRGQDPLQRLRMLRTDSYSECFEELQKIDMSPTKNKNYPEEPKIEDWRIQ